MDYDDATERGVKEAYYETFMFMMKVDILENSDFFELEEQLHLPECMRRGSLTEALGMLDFDGTYDYFMKRRVHDVQRHFSRMSGVFRGHCGPGERIVDSRDSRKRDDDVSDDSDG